MRFSKTFKRYILPSLISGLLVLAGVVYSSSKGNEQPALKKIIETRSPDGTITKDEIIVYK